MVCSTVAMPVSYTHLDVYKRQIVERGRQFVHHQFPAVFIDGADVRIGAAYIYTDANGSILHDAFLSYDNSLL